MPSLISVNDLAVSYQTPMGVVDAVNGFSLDIEASSAIGLVGESGSGKSSVARAIVGFAPVSGGAVKIGGEDVVQRRRVKPRRSDRWRVQMVFQDPYSSLDEIQSPLSAVVEAVQQWDSVPRRQARSRGIDLLETVGISERQSKAKIRTLSGGQRQRVAIARALAPRPQVLIADEPTSALDQTAQVSVISLLRRIRHEDGVALLLISHDLELVRRLVDDVLVMKEGEVVERGPVRQVLSSPSHPYTRQLASAVLSI